MSSRIYTFIAKCLLIVFSVNRPSPAVPTVTANRVSTVLLHLHICINYTHSKFEFYLLKLSELKRYTKWKIKINHEKSSHLAFTLKREIPPVTLNIHNIPKSSIPLSHSLLLGLTLDDRRTWADHIIKCKRILLNSRR